MLPTSYDWRKRDELEIEQGERERETERRKDITMSLSLTSRGLQGSELKESFQHAPKKMCQDVCEVRANQKDQVDIPQLRVINVLKVPFLDRGGMGWG